MSEDNPIPYEQLTQNALKGVVREALRIAEANGLPEQHHFYISFNTGHPQANVPEKLRQRFPDEMTIVLQHQFRELKVSDKSFSVELAFGGVYQTLTIPLDAITKFADPAADVGFQFVTDKENLSDQNQHVRGEENDSEKIVALDAFRQRKRDA